MASFDTNVQTKTTTWTVIVKYSTADVLADPAAFYASDLAEPGRVAAGITAGAQLDSVLHTGTETGGGDNVYSFLAVYELEETP